MLTPEELQTWEGRHQEVKVGNGRIIVTEEVIVFSGGEIPLLSDPVEELRDALNEIARLRDALERIERRAQSADRQFEEREPYPHCWDLSWWRGHASGLSKAADIARQALA